MAFVIPLIIVIHRYVLAKYLRYYRTRESQYKSFVENVNDVIYRSDLEGNIIMVSPSVKNLIGYDPREIINRINLSSLYEKIEDREALFEQLREKGFVTDFETSLLREDGTSVTVATSSRYYRDERGEIIGVEGVVRDISERKRAEELFNKAFMENPCIMTMSDVETGTYIEINKAYEETMEYSRTELLGHSVNELGIYKNPDDRIRIVESLRKTGKAEEEMEFVTKSGKMLTGLLFGEIFNAGSRKVFLSAVLNITDLRNIENSLRERNMELAALNEELAATNEEFEAANEELIAANTELEHAEKELRLSEKKYRTLVDNLTVGVTVYDKNINLLLSNPAVRSMFRMDNDNMKTMENRVEIRNDWKVYDEEGLLLETDDYPLKRAFRGEHVKNTVLGIYHEEIAEFLWVITDAYPSFNENGDVEQVVSIFMDITEWKIARQEIDKLKNYVVNIIDSDPDIIVGVDNDLRITIANSTVRNVSGIGRDDLTGIHLEDLLKDFMPLLKKMNLKEGLHNEISLYSEQLVMNGKISYFDLTLYPLTGNSGAGAVMRIRDVTENVNKDEQLRQIQKMETVGTLAGGLAHDFNNILGGIIGTVSILQHYLENDKAAEEAYGKYIEIIDKAGERASGMVKQLLTLSRKTESRMEAFDLNTALASVIEICRSSFDKSIEIEDEYYKDKAMVLGDQPQLEQVVLNLCVNSAHAMTFMREGGASQENRLVVSLGSFNVDASFCKKHSEASPGHYWMISCSDNGVGMDRETMSKIFDPFFTTKQKEKGTGLGLAMVYSIVHQFKGFIDVYSEKGEGTRFSIYIPEYTGEAESGSDHKEEEIASGGGLVLVIDDEEVMRITAENMLESCGYDVLSASEGDQALDIFKHKSEEIDVVLLDMTMPGLPVQEVFSEIRKVRPDIKILLSSGFRQEDKLEVFLSKGRCDFLQKPYTLKDLCKKMKDIVEM